MYVHIHHHISGFYSSDYILEYFCILWLPFLLVASGWDRAPSTRLRLEVKHKAVGPRVACHRCGVFKTGPLELVDLLPGYNDAGFQ